MFACNYLCVLHVEFDLRIAQIVTISLECIMMAMEQAL